MGDASLDAMNPSTDPPEPRPEGGSADPFPWAERYAGGDTPWDQGRAHPELEARLAAGQLPPAPAAVLVPGCGRGHDALALAAAGYRVTALDLVGELGPTLSAALQPGGGRFVVGDALAFEGGPFDLVFEHTFFCALPRDCRPAWGRLMRRVTEPGSAVAVLVFPGDKPISEGGPPHRATPACLAEALGQDFELERDEATGHPLAHRNWLERWAVFRRVWPASPLAAGGL